MIFMVGWLAKAIKEGKIRDGTTPNGRPALLRNAVHVKKEGSSERVVYSPETNSTPNILNTKYFQKLNNKYAIG
jgi:hypothetical protein